MRTENVLIQKTASLYFKMIGEMAIKEDALEEICKQLMNNLSAFNKKKEEKQTKCAFFSHSFTLYPKIWDMEVGSGEYLEEGDI